MDSTAIQSGTVAVPSAANTALHPSDAPKTTNSAAALAAIMLNRFIDEGSPKFHTAEQLGAASDYYTLEIPFTLLDEHRLGTNDEQISQAMEFLCEAIRRRVRTLGGEGTLMSASLANGRIDGEDTSSLLLGISTEAADKTNLHHDRVSETFRNVLKVNRDKILAELSDMQAQSAGHSQPLGRC